jgi:hypothetical protein
VGSIGSGLAVGLAGALAMAAVLSPASLAADEALVAAAKQEGSVTWYTTLIVDRLARPIAEAFEKKYGIKVDYVRAGSPEIYLRLFRAIRACGLTASPSAPPISRRNKSMTRCRNGWPSIRHCFAEASGGAQFTAECSGQIA